MYRQLAIAACGVFIVSSATAEDFPTRKAGLWDMSIAFEGGKMPSQTMQHCVDAQSDKLMNANFGGMAKEGCSQKDVKRSGDTITMDSVCKSDMGTTTSHAVITGNFDSAFTVKMSSTTEGGKPRAGMPANHSSNMTVQAKWLGACKAGQKPGDIMMPNGIKMNVMDLQKGGAARR
jgi:hypothetical protein